MMFEHFQWVNWAYEKKPLYYTPWKGAFARLPELEAKRKEACARKWSVLRGIWQYPIPKQTEYKIGDLIFDFDYAQDPALAKSDCFSCASELCGVYGILPSQVELFFSGSKGFGIRIPHQLFLKQVIPHTEEAYLRFASYLKKRYPSIDTALYIKARLWRLVNSIHVKTGLWRINLTLDEMNSLSMSDVRDMAASPRVLPITEPKKQNNALWQAILKSKWQAIAQKTSEQSEIKARDELRKKSPVSGSGSGFVLPDSAEEILRILSFNKRYAPIVGGVPEGTHGQNGRNHALCRIVGACRKMGASRALIEDIALLFNDRCSPPQKRSEVLKVVDYYTCP